MSFADTNTVGGVPPLPIGVKPVALPIKLTDVTGLVATLAAMPLPGNKVGQMMRWDGTAWMAHDMWVSPPPTPTSPGKQGEMAATTSAVYVCVSDNNWLKLSDPGTGAWI